METRKTEINRIAWRIYRLVRAKRDAQADLELRGLEAGAVPVANALVSGEFRSVRLNTVGTSAGCVLLIVFPVLFTVFLRNRLGMPYYLNNVAEQMVYYLSVAIACLFSEIVIAGALLDTLDAQRRRNWFKHTTYRTNEIACGVLAGASGNSSELLGGLLLAGRLDPKPSEPTVHAVDTALIRLLGRAKSERLLELNSKHRDALRLKLWSVAHLLDIETSYNTPAKRDAKAARHTAMLGKAILKAYETIPDLTALDTVRRIAAVKRDVAPLELRVIIGAAKRCLPILEENVRRARGSQELLRGSEAGGEALLRANAVNKNAEYGELLRTQPAIGESGRSLPVIR